MQPLNHTARALYAMAVAALALIAAALLPDVALAGALIASAVVATDRNIKQIRADFAKLISELEKGQKEMDAGPLSQERGEELQRKAEEAEALQAAIDQYEQRAALIKRGREIDNPTMPGEGERKSRARVRATPGHLFVMSDAFRAYVEGGKAGWSGKVDVKNFRGAPVTLSGKEAESFLERLESKQFDPDTLPDIADGVIEPTIDSEIVRFEEPEILTVRDLLQVLPTSSDTVRFVRHTATTRGAASQDGRGGLKPYMTVAFEPDTVNVETVAVLSKVTEQDIDDAPRLIGIINGEMRLDVKVEEERQLLWGSGADGELEGIFTNAGVAEFTRAATGDTLIDTIRRMRTDIRLRRLAANGALVHPIDWEDIELQKGSDERYVWAVVQTERGPRIWSMPVVESEAAENPETGERRLVVADWLRGATLYDRHDVRLAVGYVDDDFARNLRTLRAEERIALAVKRAHAFTYAVTAEGEEPGGG